MTMEDVAAAETRVRPSALREVSVEVPSVGWDDVGGLAHIKQSLKVREGKRGWCTGAREGEVLWKLTFRADHSVSGSSC